MKGKLLSFVFMILLFTIPLHAQIDTKAGSIYGKVTDQDGSLLPGVSIVLESNVMPAQYAVSGPNGSFRFVNLPPGDYSSTFTLPGFTEVRQEQIQIAVGGNVELLIIMKPSIEEQLTVIGEAPFIDKTSAGNETSYTREYLGRMPTSRDPWYIIDQTPGVDIDRFNVAGSESGQQSIFYARGDKWTNTAWNYDGLNLGYLANYFDFDSFEEIQISTGGNDASIQTGGVAINIVTKRGGNRWAANASYYFVSENLQATNTPQELLDDPIMNPKTGEPAKGSNRIDEINEYGFDIGGPLMRDRLFVWAAYRKNEIDTFTIRDVADNTTLTDYNLKLNTHWNQSHESQFGYFQGTKEKHGRALFAGQQAPETLWDQGAGDSILRGMWSFQHTWIPNDHTLINGRYGYSGIDTYAIPPGGKDVPIVLLAAIPHWEDTFFYLDPLQIWAHDMIVEGNLFRENLLGGDHELKFGFEYNTASYHTFSSYGNGVLIVDYYQTVPYGPLISGYVKAQHPIDGRITVDRTSFYISDTYRKERLTLTLGARFDYATGKNNPSQIEAVPGFEQFVAAFDYAGGDPGIAFKDFSPRLGATYDITGDGKTIVRGNYARYYDAFDISIVMYSNPTFTYNGAGFYYANQNGDRNITPDELVGGPYYYGGLTEEGFDLDAFLNSHRTDPDLSNTWIDEFIAGVEREVVKDLSVGVNYTYRKYGNFPQDIPYGISTEDYVPAGILEFDTSLGHFEVPYFELTVDQDGTGLLTNIKDYRQTYHGVDITVRKRMSHNFLLNGSLTLQRQRSHYDGGDSLAIPLAASGYPPPYAFDPTNLPFMNDLGYAYFGKEQTRPFSEWYFKLSGVYLFPKDVSIGGNVRYQQGYPFVLSANIPDNSLFEYYGTRVRRILVEPFGSRRLENKFILDIRIEKGFQLSNYGRLALILDVFNLTNGNTVLQRNRDITTGTFYRIQEVLSPRAARIGIRYSF